MRISMLAAVGLLLGATAAAAQSSASVTVLQPSAAIDIFGPRTLTPALVACTDLPTNSAPFASLRVLAAHDATRHLNYSVGEILVLNAGRPQGLMPGQQFFVRRMEYGPSGAAPSPSTPAAIRTAGWVTVVASDEHSALARVDYACDAVTAGDYLEPYSAPTLPAKAGPDGTPNFNDLGHVMFGADGRQIFGAGDVMSIDRGKNQGITLGTRVAVYRDRHIGTPLVEMGAGVVVELAADTAKVVLVRTRDAVQMGDYVVVKGVGTP